MKKIILLITIISMFIMSCGSNSNSSSSTNAEGNKVYRIATDTSFPPFEFQENGEYVGIDIDLLKEIAYIEGFEYELIPMDFGGILPAIQSGQLDAAIAGASITEERKGVVDFSDAYYNAGLVILVAGDNDQITSLDDLNGKKIAVKNGTIGAQYVEENLNDVVTTQVFEDSVSMYVAVENGQVDALIEDLAVAGYAIVTSGGNKYKIVTDKLTSGDFGFMVKKGENSELLEKFNSGLKKLKDSGKYDEIITKYTGTTSN